MAQPTSAIIDNGTVQLGVNDNGSLIVDAEGTTNGAIGLTYLPTHGEALAPGCYCEGWGIGDLNDLTHVYGVSRDNDQVNVANGTATLTVSGTGTDSLSTGRSAISIVNITMNGNAWAQVKQDFHPSLSTHLYEDTVTIKNTGTTAIGNVVYRRAMDWDVPPTEFEEYVTVQGWPASNLLHSSDDGFHSLDINDGLVGSGISPNTEDQNFTNSGPEDHGAAFDFAFGTLAPGASKDFKIFYGAAGNPSDALNALKDVGAEVYSLGMPSNYAPGDPLFGTPNTYIFGFAGVGGTPIGGAPVAVSSLGLMGRMTTTAALHHHAAIGMRMDGLSGGGDALNFDPGDKETGWKVFALVGATNGNFSPTSGTKANFHQTQFDGGVDYTFDPAMGDLVTNFRVGAALGTISGEAGGAIGTTAYGRVESTQSISGSVYGSARIAGSGYVELIGTVASYGFNINRSLGADTFTASTTVKSFGGTIRAGYDFPLAWSDLGIDASANQKLSAGPFVQFDGLGATTDAFQETSATRPLSALIFPKSYFSSWDGQVGGRINYAEQIEGQTFGLTLKAAWDHQFKNDDSLIVNSVGSLPSLAPMDVRAANNVRLGARVFMTALSNQLTVAIEDDAMFGPNGHENSVMVQARLHL